MAKVKIVINGETKLDGNYGNWTREPPPFIKEQTLAAAAKTNEDWSIPVQATFAMALLNHETTTIDVATHDHGWTLNVDHPTT